MYKCSDLALLWQGRLVLAPHFLPFLRSAGSLLLRFVLSRFVLSPLALLEMTEFWFIISQLWVGTFFYVLFCICVYILLHRPRNLGNTVFLITAITLFTLSTIQAVINLVLGASDIDGIDIPYDRLVNANTMIYVVNNVVADGLVIYRCYSIWNRNIYVVILPIILLITSSILGWDILLPFDPFFAMSLATNVLVTALTAGRIWWICRKARSYLKTDVQKRAVASISILVESGVIYSASVLAYLILGAIPSASIVQEPIFEMLGQIVGIVPTLIIVRVGMGVSVQSVESTVEAASADARPRKRPILGIVLPDSKGIPYDLDKEVPSLPYDVEKGGPVYGVGRPWAF
ncbi:hypothetical protein B0H17DRAFT_195558 [Mycena rosella]|uniref:Uncharacterized protein n=1 Tax=Mycena rosella TaxID=1033263 RepID=A0AAD7CZX4_MYCRO|nr:hypothetical protein B0H17DRAFT_195558 [Mycena rosella]